VNLSYRCPTVDGAPLPGTIIMGDGPRTRRAYRVLGARKARGSLIGLGVTTWAIKVEPMSATRGRDEIAAGAIGWSLVWDKRRRTNNAG
jgi:hypothetical protein